MPCSLNMLLQSTMVATCQSIGQNSGYRSKSERFEYRQRLWCSQCVELHFKQSFWWLNINTCLHKMTVTTLSSTFYLLSVQLLSVISSQLNVLIVFGSTYIILWFSQSTKCRYKFFPSYDCSYFNIKNWFYAAPKFTQSS